MSDVVPSQVIAPSRAIARAMPDSRMRIVFLEAARVALSRRGRSRLEQLRRLWPEGRIGLHPYIGRMGRYAPAYTLAAIVRLGGGNDLPTVFHCRGPRATQMAAYVNRRRHGRVLFDVRGASDHETKLRLAIQRPNLAPELAARAVHNALANDRRAAMDADAIVAVSEALRQHALKLLDGPPKPSAVIPCCVERSSFTAGARQRIRASLGIGEDELLLVSVSTAVQWEAWRDLADFFREVHSLRPARLLFLTTLTEKEVLVGFPIEDPLRRLAVVRRVAHREVGDYLSAADVGLLLRQQDETHRYACPIKFAEYLAAGLVVAVSSGIGSTEAFVHEHGLGVVMPPDGGRTSFARSARRLSELLESGRESLRSRAVAACARHFSWDRHAETIRRLYGAE